MGAAMFGEICGGSPKLALDLTTHLVDEPAPARLPLRLDRGGHRVEKRGAGSGI